MTSTACATRGRWSPLPIIAMIGGFAIWWPLGLAVLAWIMWGDRFDRRRVHEKFERMKAEFGGFSRSGPTWSSTTGNAAFDDYKAETLRRLDEERRKLDEEARAFSDFMANLRRARDKEEFDRFMAERRAANGGTTA